MKQHTEMVMSGLAADMTDSKVYSELFLKG